MIVYLKIQIKMPKNVSELIRKISNFFFFFSKINIKMYIQW